jgi:hypothetical protein
MRIVLPALKPPYLLVLLGFVMLLCNITWCRNKRLVPAAGEALAQQQSLETQHSGCAVFSAQLPAAQLAATQRSFSCNAVA